MKRTNVAIIGSGDFGTDLMIKVLRRSEKLELAAMVGTDPRWDGLALAARRGVPTSHNGLAGLVAMPQFNEIQIVFDATSAGSHSTNAAALAPYGKRLIHLSHAATGPFVVPEVNLHEHVNATDMNLVTGAGQATIPVVAAITRVVDVPYAEIVASISSRSAGPDIRATIDEFTETTADAIKAVGGSQRAKAIIVLNPAEPPVLMRETVLVLVDDPGGKRQPAIRDSIERAVSKVAAYVSGYRLKQDVQFTVVPPDEPVQALTGEALVTHKVSVFLEVEGAGDYLPPHAGNLDIMTSAALRVAEELAARAGATRTPAGVSS